MIIMSPVSWVKKKLGRRKFHRSKSVPLPLLPRTNTSLLQPSVDILSEPLVDHDDQEVDHKAASDLRCAYWQKTADIISDVDHELESIVLHLTEKKVTVTRKSSVIKRKRSSRRSAVPALCRNLSRKASSVAWFSSLSCLGIYSGPTLSQTKYAY